MEAEVFGGRVESPTSAAPHFHRSYPNVPNALLKISVQQTGHEDVNPEPVIQPYWTCKRTLSPSQQDTSLIETI